MHEIICPHCNKAFKVDEIGYADIVKQVRHEEFDHQLYEFNDTDIKNRLGINEDVIQKFRASILRELSPIDL